MKQIIFFIMLLTTIKGLSQKVLTDDIAIKMAAAETVFLHTNANAFFPGETLYYKLYCNTSYPNGITSKVGYVELVNNDRKVVFSHKLFFESGAADGDFFVNPSLPTGSYKLLAYTNVILNSPSKIFQIDVNIINPFQVLGKSPTITERATANTATPGGSTYSVLESQSYTKRQKVSINLQSIFQQFPNSNLSISVRKNDKLGTSSNHSAMDYLKEKPVSDLTEIKILPEWRGEIIEGSISGANVNNVPVALSIPGRNFAFKVSNTDASGNFILNIDKPHTSPDVYLQVIGANRDQLSVVTKPRPQPDYGQLYINDYYPSPKDAEAIRERSIAAQIQNAYYTRKADTLASAEPTKLFFESVERKFVLDDYTRFPTFAATIIEVVEGAYFERNGDKYSLFVRDNNPGRAIYAPTLVLVDGLMLQYNADLFAYNAAGIDHISTTSGVYLYGPTAFNGIISVVTKKQDFVSGDKTILKTEILRPMADKNYFKQIHDNSVVDLKIPDYRYQLLWLPEVKSHAVTFYTSDVAGTFDLIVEGFSADGDPISLSESFVIQ